jgi:hypothetical protein
MCKEDKLPTTDAKLLATLLELGFISKLDVPAFLMMMNHWSIADEAKRAIPDGSIAEDKSHRSRAFFLEVFRKHSLAFLQYAAHFGMTPVTRPQVERSFEVEDQFLALLFGLADRGEGEG